MMLDHFKNEAKTFIGRAVRRIWNAISKEGVNQKEVEGLTQVYMKSLENKNFAVKSGKVQLSKDELCREPKKITSELLDLFKRMEKPKSDLK